MYKSILYIAIALLCVGCVQKTTQPEPNPHVIIDSSLNALEQEKITETVLDDGSTVVVFQAWNNSRYPLEGWRRIEWFDSRGLMTKGLYAGTWVHFTAQPKSFVSFQMVSPVPHISGYRLNLRKSIERNKPKKES
jgi:uncharacterized protein YcfL